MAALFVIIALPGLLQLSSAGVVPLHPHAARVATPAIPTPTLTSDFKKNNVSAQWAPGQPIQWGSELKKYEFPVSVDGAINAALSEDEKFLALADDKRLKVIALSNDTTVSTPTYNSTASYTQRLLLRTVPGGGYDLLVAVQGIPNYDDYSTVQLRIDRYGKQTGQPIVRFGGLTSFETIYADSMDAPLSKNKRRFLASSRQTAFAYDFDDAAWNITLTGHTDYITSAVFSPDGKYISTAAWDGTGKLWDASTGALVHTFGPFSYQHGSGVLTSQNWLTRFSPNGNQILLSIGGNANVTIWNLSDLTTPVVGLSGYNQWVRTAVWSDNGEYLATGDYGRIIVYRTSDWSVVQKWQMEDIDYEIFNLMWLEGTKRLSYRIQGGLGMYDFETNLKYFWGPGASEHWQSGGNTLIVKSKGWFGGVDADAKVRFWKYPE